MQRFFFKPDLPQRTDGLRLIHLGCGDVRDPGFINVDMLAAPHVHYVHDVTDLSMFSDDFADLVYACHVLEHIGKSRLRQTIWEWRRVLKPNGILRLSVPDFDKILTIYESSGRNIEVINRPLMGEKNEFNNHETVFNYSYLAGLLKDVGFGEVKQWDPDEVEHHDFEDWSSGRLNVGTKSFQVSLNVEAVKC